MDSPDPLMSRYERQMRVAELGRSGQQKLARAAVLIVGCGALGSSSSSLLARAGVGRLRLVDSDRLQLSNLHRQTLYDETDLHQDDQSPAPKVEAAARHLQRMNASLVVESHFTELTERNIEPLLSGIDCVLDGTDNFSSRYLLNAACLKREVPWIFGGVAGTAGMTMTITPGQGPCLSCLFPPDSTKKTSSTVERTGILGMVPAIIGAIQASEAVKILIGAPPAPGLLCLDLWPLACERLVILRNGQCAVCGTRTENSAP